MTIQVLTEGEIDVMRDYIIGYVEPRAFESALISKLAAGELPEPATWGLKDFVTRCERPLFTADQLRLARAQGAAAMLSSEPIGYFDNEGNFENSYKNWMKDDEGAGWQAVYTLKDFK